MRLMGGFSWNEKAMGQVKTDKLSVITRRATRNPETGELGKALRGKLRSVWLAPPELSVGTSRKWWNLIATLGLSNRGLGQTLLGN